tara:strand:+ start:1994 stop:2515 length:522 start_codon:yes stop_codon:yes gene_type:complete
MDKEFNKQYEAKWADKDNQNIMNKVAKAYMKNIDSRDIESIKMDALWRVMNKYDPSKGTKFTSYLYQQLSYAFKTWVKKAEKNLEFTQGMKLDSERDRDLTNTAEDAVDINNLNSQLVADITTGLPADIVAILKQRFYNNMTMKEIAQENGYSRETARRRVKKAVNLCKEQVV